MKQILIIVSSFFIIFWLQSKEDKRTNRVRTTPYEKFNMYSVGGLLQIINWLKIKFSKQIINLPPELQTKNIVSINTNNIYTSLNLDNTNYDLIPSYESMFKIIDFLKDYVKDSVD